MALFLAFLVAATILAFTPAPGIAYVVARRRPPLGSDVGQHQAKSVDALTSTEPGMLHSGETLQ